MICTENQGPGEQEVVCIQKKGDRSVGLKTQTQHSCCMQGWVNFPSYPQFSGSSFTTTI